MGQWDSETVGLSAVRCLLTLRGGRENRGAALRAEENKPTAPAVRWKCTPSVACGDVSPGGGDFSGVIPCDAYEYKS